MVGLKFFIRSSFDAKSHPTSEAERIINQERVLVGLVEEQTWQIVASAILQHQNQVVKHFAPRVRGSIAVLRFPNQVDQNVVKTHTTLLHIAVAADNLEAARSLISVSANSKELYPDPRGSFVDHDWETLQRVFPPSSAEDLAVSLERPGFKNVFAHPALKAC